MPICKLCEVEEANKKKSHILPKFLGKRLFEGNKPRYSLEVKKGKPRQVQDTPKENFILCSGCEKRISILETYFARKIISIHDFNNRREDFNLIEKNPNLILECKKIHPTVFKLFFYSLYWRSSVSNLPLYENFKLPEKIETKMRIFLNTTMCSEHSKMIESFQLAENVPRYHLVIFKPYQKNEHSRGVFTVFQASEFLYTIFTPDIAIYLYINPEKMDEEMKKFSNFQNDKALVLLSSHEQWKRVNQIVIDKILPKK